MKYKINKSLQPSMENDLWSISGNGLYEELSLMDNNLQDHVFIQQPILSNLLYNQMRNSQRNRIDEI